MEYYSSGEERGSRPSNYPNRYAAPNRRGYYVAEPRRRQTPLASGYDEYSTPYGSSRRRRRQRPGASNRYMAGQEQRPVEVIPIVQNLEPRTTVFEDEVPQPVYVSRYRSSPSPPGMPGPRQMFMERSSREERERAEKEKEILIRERERELLERQRERDILEKERELREAAKARYAFASPQSDESDAELRRRERSPSPPVPIRARNRVRSESPVVEVIYNETRAAGDWENYEDFSFDCDKAEAHKSSDSLSFDTSSADQDTSPAEPNRRDDSRVKPIYHSRYTGDAEAGGSHTAQLTEIHNESGELYKWLHIQQEVMNFEEFWAEIHRRTYVSDTERRAMNRLRADITRMCVKSRSNPKGINVGYMEPRFMGTMLEPPKKTFDADQDEPVITMVYWLCMPFFILKQYSGLSSGSNLASFPSQTLLQAQYSRTTQQRDMAQAVCELGIAKKGECFHIEQLWCLIVGDSLLVTCGEMPRSKLEGDMIKLVSEPSRLLSAASAPGRILVKYGNSLTWNFSPEQCPTWFEFVAHFTAFWPRTLEFKKGDNVLTAADWPKLLKFLLTKRHKNVVLTLAVDRERTVPARALRTPEEEQARLNSTASDTPMHALALIIQKSEKEEETPALDSELKLQLEAAHKFLMEEPAYATQFAYGECSSVTHDAVLEKLKVKGTEVENEKSDYLKSEYEDGIELFNTAETLFELFLPLTCDGPTTGKFWGAVLDLACGTQNTAGKDVDSSPRLRRGLKSNRDRLMRSLRIIFPKMKAFQAIMSHVPAETRRKLEAPRQFVTAWLHVVSGLVLCCARDSAFESHISIAVGRLLHEGMDRMIQAIPSYDLLDSVVLQPFDIASLAMLKLIQDRASQPDNINEAYSQYLASLDNDITTKPSDRSYQHRIDLVRRELSAVQRTVNRQRHIVAAVQETMYPYARPDFFQREYESYYPRPRYGNNRSSPMKNFTEIRPDQEYGSLDYALKVSPTDKNGFRGLLLLENSRQIDQRDFEFNRFFDYVKDLERTVAFKMDWTKDRQENAVYAFTIVTIIFLPLSSVAGIFGMNTSDVRDMNYTQWIFWAVALPVTILVIVVGLWWMNELGNVMRWLTGQKSSGSATGNTVYGGVTAEPAEILYYSDMEDEKPSRYSRSRRQPVVENPFSPYSRRRSEVRQRVSRR